MRDVGVPGRAVGVEADPVGVVLAEVGPDPSLGERAVVRDREPDERVSVGVGDDQVEPSAVTTIPFGNAMSSATTRGATPALTTPTTPGCTSPGGGPVAKSKLPLLT